MNTIMNRTNDVSPEDCRKHEQDFPNRQAAILAALILIILSAVSYARNVVWKNEITLWGDAAKKSNNKARPHYNLGRVYRMDGRDQDALREYLVAARLDPADPVTHYNAANAYLMLGRPEEAIAQYLSAIALESDYADARYNLDVAVRILKDRKITSGEKSRSVSAASRNNLGNIYLRLGNVEAALAEYRAAIRMNPGFGDAHYNLGCAYRSLGRDREALREYQAALRCNPDDAVTHYNLGNVYYAKKRFDDAKREYAVALELKPDFEDARYNLQVVASATR